MVHATGWRRVGKVQQRNAGREKWDVTYRVINKRQQEGSISGKNNGNIRNFTTFFITEFGDKWRVQDLFFELKEFGELEEIVIPPRRDKNGRRYGFTRFLNVSGENMMEIKLDNLVLEGRKLFSNLPGFQIVGKKGQMITSWQTT